MRESTRTEVMDARDYGKDPPAELDVDSVRRMRRMVADASANGDRPWPYTRHPVPWTHYRGDWLPA